MPEKFAGIRCYSYFCSVKSKQSRGRSVGTALTTHADACEQSKGCFLQGIRKHRNKCFKASERKATIGARNE